ncbi:MAG: polysaccharide biosynthesis/export family protein [Cyanobacteria bacterium J06626_4]
MIDMPAKDSKFHVQWLRLGHYTSSGATAAALVCLGATAAIGAMTDAPVEDALLSTVPEQIAEADSPLDHYSASEQNLLSPTESSDLAESVPLQLADEPPAPVIEQSAPADVEPHLTPTAELTPDPDYTAPLPRANPTQVPTVPPQSPTANPFLDSLLGTQQPPDFDTYRLGPGDSFFVNVRQFPDLSFQATLDIQGNVIVPLQGVTTFNGLTIQETESLISQIYNQYVVDPDVSVTLVAQRGVEVTILGEVVRPGYYPLGAPQISAALLTAGGTTGTADLRSVLVQRRLPNGQLLEQTIDLFTPLKEGQELPNVALQDGDVILVERLDPAALDDYDRELVSRSTLATPIITVRFLNYGSGNLGGATSGSLTAIDLPNGSRFADALVRASLNPDTSNLGEVALIRFDEEAGRAVTTTLDGNEAFRGIPSENPPLQENDVIIVNRTVLAKLTYALNTFTQPFRDVLGFLLFFDELANSSESLFGP